MGKTLKPAIAAIVAATAACTTFLTGCNTAGCTDNRSAIPQAEFYSSATDKAISLDSLCIHGIGAPGDSVLVQPGTAVSSVYLPMRSTQTSTSWCIAYKWKQLDNPAFNDTVRFDYTAEPWFASEECGAMYRYRITQINWTSHLLDSVVATDSLITNTDAVQLRFYFRTSENPQE